MEVKKSKFDFFEVVQISTTNRKLKHFNGKTGTVIGKSEPEEEWQTWGYGVQIPGEDRRRSFEEKDLISMGMCDYEARKEYESRTSVKVLVSEDGEGSFADEDLDDLEFMPASFGFFLKEELEKTNDIKRIAKWTYDFCYYNMFPVSKETKKIGSKLSRMRNPKYAKTIQELHDIADKLINEEEIEL